MDTKVIDCFVAYAGEAATKHTVEQLKSSPRIGNIIVIGGEGQPSLHSLEGFKFIMRSVATSRFLLCMATTGITLGSNTVERMTAIASDTRASLIYSDRYVATADGLKPHPVIDCTIGSVRDDFDFGPLVLIDTSVMKRFLNMHKLMKYEYSAFYAFHLFCLREFYASIFHAREYLYIENEADARKSGEKQFDYVNPRNREVQIEREEVFTKHLKKIGALVPTPKEVKQRQTSNLWSVCASVIIPVRNRVRTIEDAVRSALSQQCMFDFNVIVVDNHSTDGTTEALAKLAAEDNRVVHIIPERNDLGIGGCWMRAVNDERCGMYAVQLDSDDLYSSPATLQRIVDKFQEEQCAMVIGSYRMCNFQLETLPPGLIDHREWTDENGANNALRINGLGAPRAFLASVLRSIGMPNTSYGEDYAMGLAISRQYKIGRIYDELYLCRRWEGNSDAALNLEQINRNNEYKDSLRAQEILARMNIK